MRFDIYRSQNKIDMLFDQIPRSRLAQIALELKVDFKFVSATASKGEPAEPNVDQKLSLILASLERESQMGTVDEPKAYFRGELPMAWGELHLPSDPEREASWIGPTLVFCGTTTQGTKLALVGSLKYLLGADVWQAATAFYIRPSTAYRIAEAIDLEPEADALMLSHELTGPAWSGDPVRQNLEFVAKTFLHTDDKLIGSPLYVAMS
jgi:hypothetical protein